MMINTNIDVKTSQTEFVCLNIDNVIAFSEWIPRLVQVIHRSQFPKESMQHDAGASRSCRGDYTLTCMRILW